MKKSIVILLSLAAQIVGFSQGISNIHFEQSGQKILLHYDLHGKQNQNDVEVFCKYTHDRPWDRPLKYVTGDVGKKVRSGKTTYLHSIRLRPIDILDRE